MNVQVNMPAPPQRTIRHDCALPQLGLDRLVVLNNNGAYDMQLLAEAVPEKQHRMVGHLARCKALTAGHTPGCWARASG